MPDVPVIDAHFHIWEPENIAMSWQKKGHAMSRPFRLQQYQDAMKDIELEGMIFVEAFVDRGGYLAELALAEQAAASDPRLSGIVAQAALDDGEDVRPFLEHLSTNHPQVKGIRRMIEEQPDAEFLTRAGFRQGVAMLADFGMTFDVNINHRQMSQAADLAQEIEGVPLILDHCGKPGIREGDIEPWRQSLKRYAQNPLAYCKLSDLPVEADHQNWKEQDLLPYIDAVVEIFGFDRLIFASDWPVCTQATSPLEWVDLLDKHFAGVSTNELQAFYSENARKVYKV